jgi:hypothetical protein
MSKKLSIIYTYLILFLSIFMSIAPIKAEKIFSSTLPIFSFDGRVDYLIITTNKYYEEVEPLSIWKTQKGLSTDIKTVQEIEDEFSGKNLAEKIKNCINKYYENNYTKWVLLAGDHPRVPSQYVKAVEDFPWDGDVVSCDSYYADLDNNWDLNNDNAYGTAQDEYDFDAEVYVGRIPANNETEMQNLIERTINYEKNPSIGWWMERALFAGSILYFNLDWNGDNICDYGESDGNHVNNFINSTHFNGWNSTFLAQTRGVKGSDYYSDMQFSLGNIKREINKGTSTCTIFAHGSPEGFGIHEWTTDYDGDLLFDYTASPFNESGVEIDVKVLNNLLMTSTTGLHPKDARFGFYYLGSCSTGTFDGDEDCLAEYLLKKAAIGVIASSYVTWGEDEWYERDHGGWFIEGLGFRFWEQFMISNRPGEALALAKADYVADRSVSPEPNDYPEWEDKCLKQYNLFSDPELPIWTKVPKQLNISELDVNKSKFSLAITAEGELIENATITFMKNGELIWSDQSDINGEVIVPFSYEHLDGMICTVNKDGYLTFQESYPELPITPVTTIPGYNFAFLLSISMILTATIIFSFYKLKSKNPSNDF